jgi:KaiC/GvpD/RAD55 family RecA-like ATPase
MENKEQEYYSGEELMNMGITEQPMLVEGLIPQHGVVALAGSSDCGKSSILRQLAVSIVSGENEFLGYKLTSRYRSVLYVSTEDDKYAMAYLLDKLKNTIKPEQLKGLIYLFDSENYLKKLKEYTSKNKVDAIIIDTFTDLYSGDMNSSNQIRVYLNKIKEIAMRANCALIFLHHTGKRTEDLKPSKSNILGSQGFEAKMRLVLELRRDLHDNRKRHLSIVKGNYVQDDQKESSILLEFKDFRFNNTGKRVPFEQLVRGYQDRIAEKTALREKVCALHNDGRSTREISEILSKEGIDISKSSVALIIKECPNFHTPLGLTDSGQEMQGKSNELQSEEEE